MYVVNNFGANKDITTTFLKHNIKEKRFFVEIRHFVVREYSKGLKREASPLFQNELCNIFTLPFVESGQLLILNVKSVAETKLLKILLVPTTIMHL